MVENIGETHLFWLWNACHTMDDIGLVLEIYGLAFPSLWKVGRNYFYCSPVNAFNQN